MKPLTSAMAAVLFHRFYREVDDSEYDPFVSSSEIWLKIGIFTNFFLQMISSSCLYLAGKVKDDPVKIRDVINVAHNTLNRDSAPLELSDEYWAMRDSIVQAELLITRELKFELSTIHPHKVTSCFFPYTTNFSRFFFVFMFSTCYTI
jgi:cyclin-Q